MESVETAALMHYLDEFSTCAKSIDDLFDNLEGSIEPRSVYSSLSIKDLRREINTLVELLQSADFKIPGEGEVIW